jgi:hypothetical protein
MLGVLGIAIIVLARLFMVSQHLLMLCLILGSVNAGNTLHAWLPQCNCEASVRAQDNSTAEDEGLVSQTGQHACKRQHQRRRQEPNNPRHRPPSERNQQRVKVM